MIDNSVFLTVIILYLASIVAILGLGILFINCIKDIFDKCMFKNLWAKLLCFVVSVLILILSLPWWFLSSAYKAYSLEEADKFYNLAINSAVIPSVKAEMCNMLGSEYFAKNEGEKAIIYLNKALELSSKNKLALNQLCLLYTIKGDNDALKICVASKQDSLIAVNRILTGNYSAALKIMNLKMKNDKKLRCWDYAERGYIYRALGEKGLAEKDFQQAFEMCSNNEKLKDLYEDEDYYEKYYSRMRKKYKF